MEIFHNRITSSEGEKPSSNEGKRFDRNANL
jgi:hypothetical protein